jgi:Zn-dependent protease with chaperone function
MGMETAEARRALIDRLEAYARRSPGGYRLRVTGLALLGLAYRAFVGLAMVAVPVAITFTMYPSGWVLFIGVVLLVLVGVFWFDRTRFEGRPIAPHDAPALFAELEKLRLKIRAPRIHEVRLTEDFNAGAGSYPRLGIFGWHRQVLVLGVPLMAALTREQLLAVIGHELGHFSRAHGRLGHWIYRIRFSWEKLNASVEGEDSAFGAAVNQFYDWFVPYFSAYSFALARLDEYEADRDAAHVTDASAAAGALTAVHVFGEHFAAAFWPAFWRGALDTPEPRANPYVAFAESLRAIPMQELRSLQRDALQRTSDLVDTHPCLTERLQALRVADVPVAAPTVCAGEALLGERWAGALEESGAAWRAGNARTWRHRHDGLAGHARRLEALRASEEGRSLEGRIETASLTERIDGKAAALALWQALLTEARADPRVLWHLGQILASARDGAAFTHLDALVERFPGYAFAALGVARQLALDLGDKTRADAATTRQRSVEKRLAATAERFSEAIEKVAFEPHGLPPHATAVLAQQISTHPAIKAAHLVRVRFAEEHFRGFGLIVRIDPVEMDKLGVTYLQICEDARVLLEQLLEPCDLVWTRNIYTTEEGPETVNAALARIDSARLGLA